MTIRILLKFMFPEKSDNEIDNFINSRKSSTINFQNSTDEFYIERIATGPECKEITIHFEQ